MSSPGARQRRRRDQYQAPRGRAELVIAVSVAVAIVAATAIMVWLLRPGGMADRQPRSSWLVSIALVAAITAVWLVLRAGRRREINTPVWLAGSLGGVLIVAIVAGIFWPQGLLRHTPPPITVPPTSAPSATTSTAPALTTTTKPGSATTKATATTTATTTAPTTSKP